MLRVYFHHLTDLNNGSPCCPHRLPCPRLRVIPEAVPQSSQADCSVSSEGPDWEKRLEMSHYLQREEDEEVSLQCTHDSIKTGSNGTYVVPLLTIGVGATMTGSTTPSKPDKMKGKKNWSNSCTEQKNTAAEDVRSFTCCTSKVQLAEVCRAGLQWCCI